MSVLGTGVYREFLNQVLKSAHKYTVWPVMILLVAIIFAGTSNNLHSQLLKWGEHFWESYYLLRPGGVEKPNCDPNFDIELRLQELEASLAEPDDLIGDLFEPEPFDREGARESLKNARALCQDKYRILAETEARITPAVKVFRSLETGVESLSLFAYDNQRFFFALLFFICASVCTITHHHIGFRPVKNQVDHWVASSLQLFGNYYFLLGSMNSYDKALTLSMDEIQYPLVHQTIILGIQALCFVSFLRLLSIPKGVESVPWRKSTVLKSLLTVPLYTYMVVIAGVYFSIAESHLSGIAIYLGQLFEYAANFLNVGLYIWVGMLLKRTQLGQLVFNVFAPWRLPPELLTLAAIIIMAVPTAFTGASGIIIIAMGLVVYEELRRVGTRRQLALATTALTGSAGVVLKPCLLVVIIAALNKEVVTDQLYSWGVKVFFLSAFIFALVAWLTRKEKYNVATFQEAFRPMLEAIKPLLPYIAILFVVAFLYQQLLGAYLDEFSAPIILPVVVLAFIFYERFFGKLSENSSSDLEISRQNESAGITVLRGTKDAIVHVGALLMIMGLSFAISGIIERSEIFESLPETFSSPWVTLSFLVVILVGIGMIMEPFGAVVMVTGTVATLAYKNGIHPVHFWMLTLVAFELGYLTPPVALNHLLTRQVVGEKESELAALEGDSFWYRYEKILLPMVVMGITLLIVAFGPLIYQLVKSG